MGWGELKDLLFETLNVQLGPLRERYQTLMDPTSELDDLLIAGAEKARRRAQPVLAGVREAIGIGEARHPLTALSGGDHQATSHLEPLR